MYKNLYWKWDNAITPELCEFFINSMDWDSAQKGTIYGGVEKDEFVDDPEKRDTDVIFTDPFDPIGSILQTRVALANRNAGWAMRIDEMQNVQVARYGKDGFYDWHRDTGVPDQGNRIRKLSVVMMLSDPESFEGGVLEIKDLHEPIEKLGQGDIIVFPSYLEHRVTPVTAGVRYSAVGWCIGPTFT